MKGKYHIIVQNSRVKFEFDIKRNITIVRGDSATGKTTLVSLIDTYDDLVQTQVLRYRVQKDA